MPWNRRDDDCNTHPKILALERWEPDLLWQKAGIHCSKARTNGVLAPYEVALVGHYAYLRTPAKVRMAAGLLVSVGLWHDAKTIGDCARCHAIVGDLGPGSYAFHDWGDCNPLREHQEDEVTKFKANRARRLKDMPALHAEILQRDRGFCRYCGVRCTPARDTRSPHGRVWDHVDPAADNTYENVVTACRRCNGRKKDRTPTEAKMPLLAPPVADPETGEFVPCRPTPDPGRTQAATQDATQAGPTPDPGRPSRSARDGSGLGRPGSGRGPGPGRAEVGPGGAGLGLVGAGPGLAGLVRAGPGREPDPSSPPPPDRSDETTPSSTDPRTTP